MKLLMENWRKYLKEDDVYEGYDDEDEEGVRHEEEETKKVWNTLSADLQGEVMTKASDWKKRDELYMKLTAALDEIDDAQDNSYYADMIIEMARDGKFASDVLGLDDFFNDLLFGEEEEPDAGTEGEEMNEELGVMTIAAGVALGGVIGVLALKAAGVAGQIAFNILSNLDVALQNRMRAAAGQVRFENQEYVLEAFQKDEKLLEMLRDFDKLTKIVTDNKGRRSPELQQQRADLKNLGPDITARLREIQHSVEADIPHPKKGGADPLSDVDRTRLRRRLKR